MAYEETKTEIFQPDAETKLLVYEWLPKKEIKAIFLAIHGGMAHGGDWVGVGLYFKELGIATYGVDLRWHGTYSQHNPGGKLIFHCESYDETVQDIHRLYSWLRKKHPDLPIFVISHSNGSLIALKYGLSMAQDTDIKGFIISSPWLVNKVKVAPALQMAAKALAYIYPKMAITPPPLTDKLTHDKKITERHFADEAAGIRGTCASPKLAVESAKTQKWVLDHIQEWKKFPLFAVVAGQDELAEPEATKKALAKVPPNLLQLIVHENNFHENFNELNRNETFAQIWNWMKGRL